MSSLLSPATRRHGHAAVPLLATTPWSSLPRIALPFPASLPSPATSVPGLVQPPVDGDAPPWPRHRPAAPWPEDSTITRLPAGSAHLALPSRVPLALPSPATSMTVQEHGSWEKQGE